jgi:cis-3-alkyl-4-acyloxetan-2-one decarboxylase
VKIQSGLIQLNSKPTFIAWAMKDVAFQPSYLNDLWLPDFPQAEVLRIPDAGHYLQEDAHEKIIPALKEFLLRTRGLA